MFVSWFLMVFFNALVFFSFCYNLQVCFCISDVISVLTMVLSQ